MKSILFKKTVVRILFVSLSLTGFLFANTGYAMSCNEAAAKTQAIQEIEYLRRWYAKATDQIGTATPEAIAEGRAIYRRVGLLFWFRNCWCCRVRSTGVVPIIRFRNRVVTYYSPEFLDEFVILTF